jgi:hypothetical protein
VGAVLGLHRAAGNAAVVQMLRAGGTPTAPVPPAPRQADRDEEAAVPSGAEPAPADLVAGATILEEGERPTKEMKAAKRAEGESVAATDDDVQIGGGGFPFTGPAPAAEGFRDAGRSGTARFSDAAEEGFDPEGDDARPRAFVPGGKTGTSPWGGVVAWPAATGVGQRDKVAPEYSRRGAACPTTPAPS